jgi:hypothetical protein
MSALGFVAFHFFVSLADEHPHDFVECRPRFAVSSIQFCTWAAQLVGFSHV